MAFDFLHLKYIYIGYVYMFAHQVAWSCNFIMFISTAVISEPDDATVCEGESTIFTCVLDSSISSDGVQWYRLLKDTGTTERLGGLKDFTVVSLPGADNFTTTLNITNAIKSYTGYYWVRSSSANVCNASLTVSAGILYVAYNVL